MKHISEVLIPRMQQLEKRRQLSLFSQAQEKGTHEWATLRGVRGDVIDAYPVRIPRKAVVIPQGHNVLRITYPPVRHELRRV